MVSYFDISIVDIDEYMYPFAQIIVDNFQVTVPLVKTRSLYKHQHHVLCQKGYNFASSSLSMPDHWPLKHAS